MISNNVMQDVDFLLGFEDSILNDLPDGTITKFGKNRDESDTDLYLEKAVYSYNHAVDTLNTACSELVLNDLNKDLIDEIRCVGSNPVSPSDPENFTAFTSGFLADNPYKSEYYDAGIGNGIGRPGDENYLSDYDRMVVLGVTQLEQNKGDGYGQRYFLASRFINEYSEETLVGIRYASDWGGETDMPVLVVRCRFRPRS